MGRFCLRWSAFVIIALLLCGLGACGGHKPPGPSPFPAKITLSPSTSASLQQGNIISFTATAQNASNASISATFTYQSSNTDILNLAPNGVACGGKWDAQFVTCTPGASGVAQVTASALGATSAPTLVFVHPPIDNIQISFVPPVDSPPPACPGQQVIPAACSVSFTPLTNTCLSPNQSWTLQATAMSKGVDITGVVGPFTWSQTSPSVLRITPTTSSSDNVPTNQATVSPAAPGVTPVFATAAGVSSLPYYAETCPVQCIALDVGSGLSQDGQTSFSTVKGHSQTITATAVDVQGCVVPKAPLTWSSSQPASISSGTGCTSGTCTVSTLQPGAASVTASCSPPTCNVGWPLNPTGLNPPLPNPQPVPTAPVYPVTPISGVVSGTTTSTSVLATSKDCSADFSCSVDLYNISTSTNLAGNPVTFPNPPNSLQLDAAGDKAYAGSAFGAMLITVANLGSASTSPFSTFSTARGQVLAVSQNGNSAVFSDILSAPNQVYIVSGASSSGANALPLNISGANAAAFSPDELKIFITGPTSKTCNAPSCLYVYSSLQALKTIPLSAPVNTLTFSSTGAFAFLSGGSTTSSVTAFDACDNNPAKDSLGNPLVVSLPTTPAFLKMVPAGSAPPPVMSASLNPSGLDVLIGLDSTGLDLIATNASQPSPTPATLCPQTIALASNPATLQVFAPQHIDLGQGTFHPINFFLSPDGTVVYIIASDRSSVLAYNFNTNSVLGIPLANNASPISADISTDGTLIYVGDSAGVLHEISIVSGTDMQQISFTTPPRFVNPFCSLNPPSPTACTLNLVAVKP